MTTKNQLDLCRAQNIQNIPINELSDINSIAVDKSLPTALRILSFIDQVGNPYCFRVGDVKVKIGYAANGPTLKNCLENILRKKVW